MQLDPALYGEGLADIYDLIYPVSPEVDSAADFVAARTPAGGTVLEFGVGTGRIATALAERGLKVNGVDASQRMLDRLAEKTADLPVMATLGDFTSVDCGGSHDTVLIALNTLFMVPSQEGQIQVLQNARRHLADDGALIVEVYEPTRFHSLPGGTDTMIQHLDRESLLLCSIQVDKVNQIAAIGQAYLRSGELRKTPEISRYAFPAEVDLMARIAGLQLTERYEDWDGRYFEHRSVRHISVYRPVPDAD
ncbi:class I SAM-dependent methyltransferase [Nakamurella flavida]|uniref:Class I SAM-dependent methyltransferase n=1 Tax=Nakamurella flavida TaxID=363630 RepID=A0A938YKC1_9ACTN|nr:class I SAM-dependent methyltransferase [Nakamurella flavida]MBM9476754.1 class I SAM-dependent methyltransferase [Nakamurella flavida]MDP9778808.1 SAM-dependent methyltransferase [Nakamurella flavida]